MQDNIHAFRKERTMRYSLIVTSLCAVVAGPVTAAEDAKSYPARPVRLLVPFAPAGPTDIMARVVAQRITETRGWTMVVDNRPGAGGNFGATLAARATPDGYTILCHSSAIAVNVTLFGKPGYSPGDFAPIINSGVIPNLIFAHPSFPASTLQETIKLGKVKILTYASAGIGTTPHLTAERLLKTMAKLDLTHIPYNSAGLAANAVVSGEVQVGTAAVTAPAPFIKAGRLKGIVVTSPQRSPALPDVPTVAESGFPGYEDYTWIAFFAPRGTPRAVVLKLNSEITTVLQTPVVKERLAALGFDFTPNTPEQFGEYFKREIVKWGQVVKESGARVD
jgi:tripartite-type tricarboxylate transporter receptor subunit TctC